MAQQCLRYIQLLLAKLVDSLTHGVGQAPQREQRVEDGALVVHQSQSRMRDIYNDVFLFFGNAPVRVHERMWLGNAFNATDHHLLTSIPIVGVVNATMEVPNFYHDKGILYHNIMIRDDLGCKMSHQLFEKAAEFMDMVFLAQPHGHILVHCFVGRSRSVAICCYWLMTRHQYSFDQAYQLITELRPFARINDSFARTLRNLP
jgi:protein-tyrosine phosphatase